MLPGGCFCTFEYLSDVSHNGQTIRSALCTDINGAAAQPGVAPEAMRSVTRALGNAVRSQRHLAGLQQRTQASLAAREVTQPELPPFDHEPVQYTGPSKQEVIDLRKRYLNPGEPQDERDKALVLLARQCSETRSLCSNSCLV